MDNREIPQKANGDIMGFEIRDRNGTRGLREEGAPIKQRAVGIAA